MLQTHQPIHNLRMRISKDRRISLHGRGLAVGRSLAILNEELGDSSIPQLRAICGDVNISNDNHNVLMSAMTTGVHADQDPASIHWSKPIPPTPELSHKHELIQPGAPANKVSWQQHGHTAYHL